MGDSLGITRQCEPSIEKVMFQPSRVLDFKGLPEEHIDMYLVHLKPPYVNLGHSTMFPDLGSGQ